MAYLDVPIPVTKRVEVQLVCDLSGSHGVREILLVGEDKENGISELILCEHASKLFLGLSDTLTIVAVNDEDKTCPGRRWQ